MSISEAVSQQHVYDIDLEGQALGVKILIVFVRIHKIQALILHHT